MKMADGITRHLIKRELKNQSSETSKAKKTHLKKFEDFLLDRYSLDETKAIRKYNLQAYQSYLGIECDLSPSYINQNVVTVNAFMAHMIDEGEAVRGLDKVLECLKLPRRLPKVISLDEFDKMCSTVQDNTAQGFRDFVILTVLLSSGIRLNELHKLDLADVDMKEKTLRVIGKGDKERLAIFGEGCKEAIQIYLDCIRPLYRGAGRCKAFLMSRNAKRLSKRAIQDAIKRAKERAGIESHVSCHTFRRVFTTELIKADCNLYMLARMLGHESLEHLKSYGALDTRQMKENHKRCHPRG